MFWPQFWWDSSPSHVFYAQVCEAVCSRLWTSFRMRPAGLWAIVFLAPGKEKEQTLQTYSGPQLSSCSYFDFCFLEDFISLNEPKSNSLVPEEFIGDPQFMRLRSGSAHWDLELAVEGGVEDEEVKEEEEEKRRWAAWSSDKI